MALSGRLAPADIVQRAITSSEFLRGLAAARAAWRAGAGLRLLTPEEIKTLRSLHNAAEDWTRLRVAPNFNPNKVVGCYFMGDVQLGGFTEKVQLEQGVFIGSGVYNCDLNNVSVGDNAYLSNNTLIANCHIGPGAIVEGCGSVVGAGETTFGNGQQISLGLEGSGRETPLFAEITVDVAACVAGNRQNRELLAAYAQAVAAYAREASSGFMVIENGAVVRNTPKILNCYIGRHAVVDAAAWLENLTVLSGEKEPTHIGSGACVRNSLVQWGARIETHALVEHSVCCEFSCVDRHGKLTDSLLGPNSTVSAGECVSSLVGPFVGFHHQALLISAYWPEGKGNIGYGANVGSNHTSKAPDQEIWPGEGTFFGLGVSIKFPTDFSKAPYSVIAAGLCTLPQRCEMPFSLITVRAETLEGVSPAYNEIVPGWVLSDNIYAVRRNERKYAIRNKATHCHLDHEVFRPEIVALMLRARAMLQEAERKLTPARAAVIKSRDGTPLAVYTDKDIAGLGKNFMKETARLEGIEAYTFYIRLYALRGLRFAIKFALEKSLDPRRVLEAGYIKDARWDHERGLLLSEFPGKTVPELLPALVAAHEKMAADTLLAKEKDDFRGVRIIPDYASVHTHAKDDPFVVATQQETVEVRAEVAELLAKLKV